MKRLLSGVCAALLALSCHAGEVEVLHFWTTGAEAGALANLKASMRSKGHTWRDFAVADGGGGLALTLLSSRVNSGNPPTAAQIKGASIQEWGRAGKLANIDTVAQAERWDALLPPIISNTMKFDGHYVAAPLNVHRVNWLWVNAAALKKANARMPTSWDEFFAVADAMRKAGIAPLAYSGQSWLDLGTFETVIIGIAGVDFYKRAFMQLDPAALNSAQMEQILQTFKRIKAYTGPQGKYRDWVAATAALAKGEAGMQLMGDWAKSEIYAAGKLPGVDILCTAAPGTSGAFTFDIDSLALFKVAPSSQPAQQDLARAVMGKDFQRAFNLAKGSIPVRQDVKLDGFDECARQSSRDFAASAKRGTLLPSVAHGMGLPYTTTLALWDVIRQYWNQDSMSAKIAMARMAQVAAARR
ncbi:extracellular solute-binding protein [Duganella sp. FT80W]|uniref:Probable sugar-binding periplasmic protein n=1 Tax=Duganella guangzhouensis TaxID=2666084 RepID=A0A6I2KVN3_9BURK|nr:ABC transporter substrate-binding protein [Duganella guangzhouensis]MRW89771.1 extracellular solute-binding protein [Duganella guangzhouensis]